MKVVVTEQARSSLLDERNYYNAQMGGLGYEFVQEFVAAVSRIKTHPEAWTLLSKRTRRCLANKPENPCPMRAGMRGLIRRSLIFDILAQCLNGRTSSGTCKIRP